METTGTGYDYFPFATQTILGGYVDGVVSTVNKTFANGGDTKGNIYADITHQNHVLSGLTIYYVLFSHLSPGTKINPGNTKDWPFDDRYFFFLEDSLAKPCQVKKYQLNHEPFKENVERIYIRLMLWISVTLDAVEDFFDMSGLFTDEKILCGCILNCQLSDSHNICQHHQRNYKSLAHLWPFGLSLLFGGFTDRDDLVNQVCHLDVKDMKKNTKLISRCKPCILVVPLEATGRDIFFMDTSMKTKVVHVGYNDALIFGGNTPHGGVTYQKNGTETPLHCALHIAFYSSHHKVKTDDAYVTVMPEQIAMNDPALLSSLNSAQQLHAVKSFMDVAITASENCLKSPQSNADLGKYLEKSLKKMQSLLSPLTGSGSRSSRKRIRKAPK